MIKKKKFNWRTFDLGQREYQLKEMMDDINCDETLLYNTLNDFKYINFFLSFYGRIFYRYLLKPAQLINQKENRPVHLADIGSGGGDIAYRLHSLFNTHKIPHCIFLIETDKKIKKFLVKKNYPAEIQIVTNIQQAKKKGIDFWLSNHLIHHLEVNELQDLLGNLNQINQKYKNWVIFNDIHRSKLALYLYQIFIFFFKLFFRQPSYARYDGTISILKSWKKKELKKILSNFLKLEVVRFAPFRQLVISKELI